MKIRGRLIIAFLLITIFPMGLILVSTSMILSNQVENLANGYQTETNILTLLLNPIQVLSSTSMSDFKKLAYLADSNPDSFASNAYLKQVNKELIDRYSFLVIKKSGQDYFIGNTKTYSSMGDLPGFGSYRAGVNDAVSIENNYLIKQKDFYFTDQTKGQIFLITDLASILSWWESTIKQLILSVTLIILITALSLVVWLYNGIARPLSLLRIATMQIGSGNLSEPVEINSTDEIGALAQDFEKMRMQLLEMINDRIRYEEDTRVMMSSMAHDLHTPLTSIKGYAEGLLDGIANTPDKQEKYLQTICSKANDMSYLVDELSVFSKVEQNSLAYHFLPIPLHSYFEDCIEDFSLDMETKNMTIHYKNFCARETKIYADPEQLKRVIQNIMHNASKYMDKPKGNIWLNIRDFKPPEPETPLYRQLNPDGTPKENPEAEETEQFVQVEFQDDGPGISEKDLPFIFQRFFRADASRSTAKRGSGLGLAIVSHIIEDHGGMVWAESTLGKGTCIYFTLKKHLS